MSAARRVTLPLAALVFAGCARMGSPPGGPPDFTPPRLLGTVPESVAVLPGFDDWVEFRFDEVVSEGGQPNFGFGSGGLERLVMISPDSGVPRVRWRRDRIAVRPREGWRPNTVYRVELGAGVGDLAPRPNTRDSAAVITFTTGAPHPTRWLEGSAVDWTQQRFAPRALIEATLLPDSLVYRTTADTAGRFRLGPLPDGEFLVTAVLDVNTNRRRDGREGWDSVRATAGVGTVGEIWAFPRDTVPPRIEQNGISRVGSDSFAIAITLSQPVHPDLRLGPEAVTILRLSDSTALPAASAFPSVIHDSIYAPIDSARRAAAARAAFVRDSIAADSARAARDTSAAARDTTRIARPDTLARVPRPADREPAARPAAVAGRGTPTDTTDLGNRPTQRRPAISPRLLIRTNGPLEPGQRYLIEVRGVRALSGTIADTLRGQLDIPEARRP